MNVPPAPTSLEAEIRETINGIVKTGPISVTNDTDLFTSNTLDSFNMIELIAQLEETYGVAFQMDDLTSTNFGSIAAIARTVDTYRSGG